MKQMVKSLKKFEADFNMTSAKGKTPFKLAQEVRDVNFPKELIHLLAPSTQSKSLRQSKSPSCSSVEKQVEPSYLSDLSVICQVSMEAAHALARKISKNIWTT